ncbi:TIR domain-containing protein [Pelomonas sp. P7]|uniref:TIR domain-containing protein n=1 Tax=Pelomonas caseinilytica TaxID=2906763 RepID=A0ABS8XM13_9BURK|nr:TIR domain-containing protein [Pelomonas sp. P7]MCE4540755.1 TIR domain-containing protein [Pelomonas sp. P7]
MARVPVFYSFHFDNDVMRVQQIRQMGMIDGDEPVSPNDWETVKRGGAAAVERWIDDNMKYKRCVVVLIGSQTHVRPWVQHEIRKAWSDNRGLLGIHIHNLNCPRHGTCAKGTNPFDQFVFRDSNGNVMRPPVYDPPAIGTYNHIRDNLAGWVDDAVARRR